MARTNWQTAKATLYSERRASAPLITYADGSLTLVKDGQAYTAYVYSPLFLNLKYVSDIPMGVFWTLYVSAFVIFVFCALEK
jgi:hypothetical protein